MNISKKSFKINVGDVVSIFEVVLKRRHWKVGKVLRIIRGKDDVIRGAVVQIFNEKNGKETINRSVLGVNLLIELLCWERNQGLQSIKSTTISFPTYLTKLISTAYHFLWPY